MKIESSSFEQELATHGELIYRGTGTSMRPLIRQGRDLMIIHPRPVGRLKRYDCPLYFVNGKYILHRIVKVRENDYVLCGDNTIRREYGIRDEQIIGVLAAVVRKGKQIPVTSRGYRLYSVVWTALYCVRIPVKKTVIRLKHLLRKLKR